MSSFAGFLDGMTFAEDRALALKCIYNYMNLIEDKIAENKATIKDQSELQNLKNVATWLIGLK